MSETGDNFYRHGGTLPEGVTLSNPQLNPRAGTRPGGKPDDLPGTQPQQSQQSENVERTGDQRAEQPQPNQSAENTPHRQPNIVVRPPGPTIAIINHATVVNADQVQHAVAALQQQLNNDFAPVWGTTARLRIITDTSQMGTYDWLMAVADDTDQAGALGYHDLTDQGQPVGFVFAKTDADFNLSWTVTLSHEILEMLMDPYISNVVFNQTDNTGGKLYAFEMCDAVEDDSLGYQINGVLLSNFVYPAYFESFRQNAKYDHQHKLTAPFSLATGGYMSVFPIPNKQGWVQVFGQEIGARLKMKLERQGWQARTLRRSNGGINHLELSREEAVNVAPESKLDEYFAHDASTVTGEIHGTVEGQVHSAE